MIRRGTPIFLLSLLFTTQVFSQERIAWSIQPIAPKTSIYWMSLNYFESSQEFAVGGFRRDLFRVATSDETTFPVTEAYYNDRTLSMHYEYGVTRKFTLVARLGFKTIRSTYIETDFPQGTPTLLNKEITSSGFDDLWLWGRYELLNPFQLRFPFRLSAQAGVKLPTGDILAPVALGTGVLDYDAHLLGELNFFVNNNPSFIRFDVGYRLRGGEFQNQSIYRLEFGLAAATEVSLRVGLSGITSIGELNSLIGIGEIPRPAATRPLTIIGDERFGQVLLGIQTNFSPTFIINLDYHKRLYGNATFVGELIQFSVALIR